MNQLRRKLSYANVMSTIAVFIALAGGTAFAISQISGKQIKNRTIAGKKLKNGAIRSKQIGANLVVPKARMADHASLSDRTAQLAVSGGPNGSGKQLNRRLGTAGGASGDYGSLVTLAAGETVTVIDKPPFQVIAKCLDTGGGDIRLKLFATSTQDGWSLFGQSPTHNAGETVDLVGYDNTYSGGLILSVPLFITAPGSSLLTGSVESGTHVLGNDCALSMFAIGE